MTAPRGPEQSPDVPEQLEADACPRCGTPHDAHQEYCLECGLRLPSEQHGVVASLGGAWRRRLRWYPGDWIWATLGLLAVAAIGAATAVAASRDNSSASKTLIGTTTPGVTTRQAVRTTPVPAETQPPAAQTVPSATAPTPRPAPRRQRTLRVWPAGERGWTIVLRSETARPIALREARRAIAAGLRDVGVIDSADYSSLHPGYFVVFSGVYTSQADAEEALETATSGGYERAYVRPVSP
jgi:hypothetical protein